ncbi:unnamed protein product [Lymnaea stagnalis]|uniref:Uncharacterized protein n=1 Tax=Lymnaea stagnalis TaxID=6523 RepID=A0AAV2I0Z5_LYMST
MGAIRSRLQKSAREESLITSRQLAFMEELSKSVLNKVTVKDRDEITKTISTMVANPEQALLLKQSGALRLLLQLSTEYSTDPHTQRLREDATGLLQHVALCRYDETRPKDVYGYDIFRMLNCLRLFCFHECERELDDGAIKFTCATKYTCMKAFRELNLFVQDKVQMKAFCKLCGVDALAMLMVTRQQALGISCDPENSFIVNICNIFSQLFEQTKELSPTKQMLVDELRSTVLSTPGVLSTWRMFLETDNKNLKFALVKLINSLVVWGAESNARLLAKEGFIQVLIQQIMEEKTTWNLTFPAIKNIMVFNPPSINDACETEGFIQFLFNQFLLHSTSDINLDHLNNLNFILLVLIDRIAVSEKLFAILQRSGLLWLWQHQLESNSPELQNKAFYILIKVCKHRGPLMAAMGLMQSIEQFKHSSAMAMVEEHYHLVIYLRSMATMEQEVNKEDMIRGG